ncbi:MAG: CoA-binding protein [Solirubrobacterales bacterium]|nr:CoA-binding protein [Solirubrobacterales bacterium]
MSEDCGDVRVRRRRGAALIGRGSPRVRLSPLVGHTRGTALHTTQDFIRDLLTKTHTWAVVGCSPDPRRASHRVARVLQHSGFRVIPVNPHVEQLLGERCYPRLTDIPAREGVEVVDIFRRADQAGVHVDEAIEIDACAIWMQLGVVDEAAAQRALAAGLLVVMDRCPAIELPRLAV